MHNLLILSIYREVLSITNILVMYVNLVCYMHNKNIQNILNCVEKISNTQKRELYGNHSEN